MDINWLQLFMSLVLILIFGLGTGALGPRRRKEIKHEDNQTDTQSV